MVWGLCILQFDSASFWSNFGSCLHVEGCDFVVRVLLRFSGRVLFSNYYLQVGYNCFGVGWGLKFLFFKKEQNCYRQVFIGI